MQKSCALNAYHTSHIKLLNYSVESAVEAEAVAAVHQVLRVPTNIVSFVTLKAIPWVICLFTGNLDILGKPVIRVNITNSCFSGSDYCDCLIGFVVILRGPFLCALLESPATGPTCRLALTKLVVGKIMRRPVGGSRHLAALIKVYLLGWAMWNIWSGLVLSQPWNTVLV
uniref:Uncharacterized protein n=1 Tax=Glossina pallidipes TaxID=7398 RepID=A0A1B0AH78_GLOPL